MNIMDYTHYHESHEGIRGYGEKGAPTAASHILLALNRYEPSY